MSNLKHSEQAFPDEAINSIPERLKLLFRGESMRKASARWGVSYSTLNNYFARGATPSIEILVKIAAVEGVTLEWLATGKATEQNPSINTVGVNQIPETDVYIEQTIDLFLKSLEINQLKAIVSLFFRLGVEGVLARCEHVTSPLDYQFMQLSNDDKGRVMRLFEQVKKGADTSGQMNAHSGPGESDSGAA
ncbi:helix-turn-helix domain-containing protein [Citrobacter braakii]|uniref:helix-turn-helix domain-containing protein n=1 Tax=Citrobacter braakii TaxID=57706 RepID=UPI0035267581